MITEANTDDAILANRLRAHKEALEYLEPALMDWDERLKATATVVCTALITHEVIVRRKAAALETMNNELSDISSVLPRAFELISLIKRAGSAVMTSTAACTLLRERSGVIQQRLTANIAYGAMVETEIETVTGLIRAVDKRMKIARYKERHNSPPTNLPKNKRSKTMAALPSTHLAHAGRWRNPKGNPRAPSTRTHTMAVRCSSGAWGYTNRAQATGSASSRTGFTCKQPR